jgi:hypothetical protein
MESIDHGGEQTRGVCCSVVKATEDRGQGTRCVHQLYANQGDRNTYDGLDHNLSTGHDGQLFFSSMFVRN